MYYGDEFSKNGGVWVNEEALLSRIRRLQVLGADSEGSQEALRRLRQEKEKLKKEKIDEAT